MSYNADQYEKEILEFWEKNKTFEKSVESRQEDKPYVFYDGPPFATGLPHYGHILSSVIKDVVPRYQTMKGFRVRRRWGWDCHGLPIEQLIEKELEVSGKKQIENEIGVEKFNDACRSTVLKYTQEWKKMVDRIGRWIEFDNSYKTMDSTYMESVWWALKTIWDKGLIYEGRKVLMYCPRCETPVSKAEIAMDNSYKDITEEAVTIRFKLKEGLQGVDGDVYVLAWTTTPWTLPGNLALAVGEDISYALVEKDGEHYILAKELVGENMGDAPYNVVKEFAGKDLVGIEYEPLFDMPAVHADGKKAYYIAAADFVTTEDGTGIVHTAVMYGEDDYNLGLEIDLPVVPMLDEAGHFTDVVPAFIQGQYFKKAEKEIKKYLEKEGSLFAKAQNTHSYPHCWRCDTQLFYNAVSAWFINIQNIKDRLIKLNEKINWFPEHLKNGRFLNILETAPDWNISRSRYWATALPFWKCEKEECEPVCIGSVAELKEKATNFDEVFSSDKVEDLDLHKHNADKILLKCDGCEGLMRRIPEVIDCWVESGSMPFAEFHYPFENKDVFEKRFPGQYIAEYIAQTRAWFYYMHVMATLLFGDVSFENVVTTGTILNEKGEKLSKSKRNFTDPWENINKYGVDALRYYLMSSVVMQSENMLFNDREVRDVYNKVINITWNVTTFYTMFADEHAKAPEQAPKVSHVLDKWILAKTHALITDVTTHMDAYDTVKASRPLKEFVADLSTWYVRRSRDRFKGTDEKDKKAAQETLQYVLLELSKLMAPFMPFLAEKIYQVVGGKEESVHLDMWPVVNEKLIDEKIISWMKRTRLVCSDVHAARKIKNTSVRQPLSELLLAEEELALGKNFHLPDGYLELIRDEVNIKKIAFIKEGDQGPKGANWFCTLDSGSDSKIFINFELDNELKKEGLLREIIRAINGHRKEHKLTPQDMVVLEMSSPDALVKDVFQEYKEDIMQQTKLTDIQEGGETELDVGEYTMKVTLHS